MVARLFALAKQRTGRPAFHFSQRDGWGVVSWDQYAAQVRLAARAFMALGLKRGGRVAILSDARPEWAVVALAVQACGGSVVVVPPSSTTAQLKEIAAEAEPLAFVVDDAIHWEALSKAADSMKSVKHFVGIQLAPRHANGLSWTMFLTRAAEVEDETLEREIDSIEPASESTLCYSDNRLRSRLDKVRGARLSHGNQMFAADSYTRMLGFHEDDKMLVFMPFSDTTNRMLTIYQCINSGSAAYYGEAIDKLHANLTSVQPTVIFSAPVLWERFEAVIKARLNGADPAALPATVKEKLRRFIGCANLRVALTGTAHIHHDTIKFYAALGIVLRAMYSKTALSGIATLDMSDKVSAGSAGKAVPDVRLRLEDGQLMVAGPNVFMGYLGKDKPGEWFATGDAATVSKEGDVKILGNLHNSFKLKSGAVVHPELLELQLRASPIISGACVFGEDREFPGAILAIERDALLSQAKKLNMTVDELAQSPDTLAAIDKHVQKVNIAINPKHRILKYRVIPREFVPNDEVTSTMLLCRSVVLSKFDQLINEMYAAWAAQQAKK